MPADVYSSNASPAVARPRVRRGRKEAGLDPDQSAGAGSDAEAKSSMSNAIELGICIAGIYVSFVMWAYIQERMTLRTAEEGGRFEQSMLLYVIQSLMGILTGLVYMAFSNSGKKSAADAIIQPKYRLFPSKEVAFALLGLAVISSSAQTLGFISLQSIDYVTYLLAKSCKLLPVMAVQVSVFRKRYSFTKYLLVIAVTAGVSIFTIYHPGVAAKAAKHSAKLNLDRSADTFFGISTTKATGLALLGVNLLFEGVINSVQDQILEGHRDFNGPQLMVAQNACMAFVNLTYLLFFPQIGNSPLGQSVVRALGYGPVRFEDQLTVGARHLIRWPAARADVFGFAACGAVGQIFIFQMLARFSSVVLVTVTVTRKMVTMLLSIVLFGHRLTVSQWAGVALVFGGVAAEAIVKHRESEQKRALRTLKGEAREAAAKSGGRTMPTAEDKKND